MKKITVLLLALLLLFSMGGTAFAETEAPRIVDEAGLLSDNQEAILERTASSLAEEYDIDVVILTVYSLDDYSAQDYADDYFDYNGYGIGSDYSGVLLLISTEERDWAISTCGDGITAVTDYGIDQLITKMSPDLSRDDYYEAFDAYLDKLEYLLERYAAGDVVDRVNQGSSRKSFTVGRALLCLVGAAAVSGLAVWLMTSRMNTARKQSQAAAYLEKGSFKLVQNRDIFLYSNTTRTRRQQERSGSSGGGSSTHRSSSGRSHGGGSGKF